MKCKVLLLGAKEVCAQVQVGLRDEDILVVGTVSDENRVLDEINRTTPDVVLVTETSPMALRACHQIYLLRPRSIPVILSDMEDNDTMQKVMQAGVHYVLPASISQADLVSEVKNIGSNEINRIVALESTGAAASKSKVISFFSVKDGVGKTTLAVNLAVKLAERKNKVVVLDFDFQFGDVAAFFGQDPKNTILELVQEQKNPNADTIRQFLTIHVSGVGFLPAPHSPEYGNMVTTSQIEQIIAALRIYYDYVIIDSPAGFNDVSASCVDSASTVLYVVGRDVSSLRNAKKAFAMLASLAGEEKIKLVIGKSSEIMVKDIGDGDVSRVMGMPVWQSIPGDERAAITAINQGVPFISDRSKSKVNRAISNMADLIDGPAKNSGFGMGNNTNAAPSGKTSILDKLKRGGNR